MRSAMAVRDAISVEMHATEQHTLEVVSDGGPGEDIAMTSRTAREEAWMMQICTPGPGCVSRLAAGSWQGSAGDGGGARGLLPGGAASEREGGRVRSSPAPQRLGHPLRRALLT